MNRFYKHKQSGFTLVELLVALMIMAIVLAAAATMADALACGKETNDRMSRDLASLLQVETRLSDLVMRANDVNEVVEGSDQYIGLRHEREDGTSVNTIIKSNVGNGSLEIYEGGVLTENYTKCRLVKIEDMLGGNPSLNTKGVTIQFAFTENEIYSVSAVLRGGTN